MLNRYQSHNINFVGGFQFWSNPALAETKKAIPIVLLRPTFLDLMKLSLRFGVDTLLEENELLFQLGEMTDYLHKKNLAWLRSIKKGLK